MHTFPVQKNSRFADRYAKKHICILLSKTKVTPGIFSLENSALFQFCSIGRENVVVFVQNFNIRTFPDTFRVV